jgi:histidinol-phosphate aminotransferase
MIRTFSKIYGLAALRLGWGYFPAEIAATFQRIRPPFNINAFAVAAGNGQHRLIPNSSRRAGRTIRSGGTIYVSRLERGGTCRRRRRLPISSSRISVLRSGLRKRTSFMKQNNVLVRAIGGYGLPSRLRISIGSAEDNETVLGLLESFTASR